MPVRPARAPSRALKTAAARPRRQDAALVALYVNNNASDVRESGAAWRGACRQRLLSAHDVGAVGTPPGFMRAN